jgi:hypothetical protein
LLVRLSQYHRNQSQFSPFCRPAASFQPVIFLTAY